VTELRHALAEDQDGQSFIENIPKKGYRLVAPVAGLDEARNEGLGRRSSSWLFSTPAITLITVLLLGIVGIYTLTMLSESNRGLESISDHVVRPPANSITVLPFINNSRSAENEYFSDGLTETLLHALAQLPDLKVTARTSAFYFKGQDLNVREIADKLGVSKVLEGSVQRDGNRVRIVAQLIEAETGFQLWSDTYDRELSDIFAVQEDIANSVALAMSATLSGAIIETASTDSVAAYEKYLKGLHQQNMGSNKPLLLAEISFREALVLDPGYFDAKLELAYTYWEQQRVGEISRAEASEYVIPLLDELLNERPDSGLVLAVDAFVRGDEYIDVDKRVADLTAAIARTPNEPRIYRNLARLLRSANRQDEELQWLDRGIAVDPFDWDLHYARGRYLMRAGDLDGAEASYERVRELNPEYPTILGFIAEISMQRKKYAEWFSLWRTEMELGPLDHAIPSYIAMQFYTLGLMNEGDKYLHRATTIAPDKIWVRLAELYRLLLLGDQVQVRELSEAMLRDDIEDRWGAYRMAVMVYVSTMCQSGKTDEALTVLEELRPGISSVDFHPRTIKEQALQYHAVLALAPSQSDEEIVTVLDAVVPRWDESFPRWRDVPGIVAPIAMARGRTEMAVELMLQNLEGGLELSGNQLPYLKYRHIDYYEALATEPPVAERLAELDAESKKAGEDIWAYIVQNNLQL
jgi:TolB-like protein/tetratricopeptide (TPR) repeat protein